MDTLNSVLFITMELMGILEPGCAPKELMWYAFEPGGTAPSPRVGQTCMYLPADEDSGKGKIVIVGGANPGCCFSDAHVLNLDTYKWYGLNWDGLSPRYEHASFISTGNPGSMWVFGGATQAENQNSVQVINLANLTWTMPNTSGVPPKPRHGHIMVAVGSKLFVHAGMAGKTFYEDLFCIDTDTMKWKELKVKGDVPPACAAHSALSWEKRIYIFGGMTETGAVSTMHRYDTGNYTWTRVQFDSPSPAARLDHSMCLFPWKIRMDLSKPDCEPANVTEKIEDDFYTPNKDYKSEKCGYVTLCLIFGGMDTNGELYSDCSVTALTK
ncbi:rab9 effector protein with kelch motifs isoform X4 [Rana temporaria]|uniref:rab9 effector protein with kelch motifs isoform X4 n=1 Tax=Rana temporaria TaxID=8407 RepID=UPI001AAD29E3|nr:rab9 effector protein with kelch motifs isoform X4 [Rana temporaria]